MHNQPLHRATTSIEQEIDKMELWLTKLEAEALNTKQKLSGLRNELEERQARQSHDWA